MPSVKETIFIAGDPKQIFEITKASDRFPEFMPDVDEVNILQRKEKGVISEWKVTVDGTPFYWKEEDVYDDENMEIRFKAIEGDVDLFQGYWKVIPQDGGANVEIFVEFDINMPGLKDLILPMLTAKLRENLQSMLKAIKERVEGTSLDH